MSDALKKLIEAVEAGDDWISVQAASALPPYQAVAACNAYGNGGNPFEQGSLDAAKSLHDSLLPGTSQYSIVTDPTCLCVKVAWWPHGLSRGTEHLGEAWSEDNPSRAWLLAILKAKLQEDRG